MEYRVRHGETKVREVRLRKAEPVLLADDIMKMSPKDTDIPSSLDRKKVRWNAPWSNFEKKWSREAQRSRVKLHHQLEKSMEELVKNKVAKAVW